MGVAGVVAVWGMRRLRAGHGWGRWPVLAGALMVLVLSVNSFRMEDVSLQRSRALAAREQAWQAIGGKELGAYLADQYPGGRIGLMPARSGTEALSDGLKTGGGDAVQWVPLRFDAEGWMARYAEEQGIDVEEIRSWSREERALLSVEGMTYLSSRDVFDMIARAGDGLSAVVFLDPIEMQEQIVADLLARSNGPAVVLASGYDPPDQMPFLEHGLRQGRVAAVLVRRTEDYGREPRPPPRNALFEEGYDLITPERH